MARYVLKFGGTSVANVTRLQHVAHIIKKQADAGHELVVVVSAMAGITNKLVEYAHSLCPDKLTNEHDVVLSSGEQITSGLLALALSQLGFQSRSYLAWQIPIQTDDTPSQGRISNISTARLEECLRHKRIPVVAGFQGVNSEGRLTTLGRGGSDTTAVALAAALNADRCDIYTDVDGVYNADPRLVANARKLSRITYDEMFEMAAQGAKVLQARSVELAMKHGVKLRVLSSFVETPGTDIVKERENVESTLVSGIAHSQNDVRITIKNIPNHAQSVATIFSHLAENAIPIDMIVQTSVVHDHVDLTFTLLHSNLERAQHVLKEVQKIIPYSQLDIDTDIVKISIIGVGIRSDLNSLQLLFQTLAIHNISVQLMTTSEIKLCVIIDKHHTDVALNALHQAYELEKVAA
ncbi:aspartate kinase [Candidatus Finniella inopinata]|uniref:Aspartokinase n=1 Tax=Candidatus Finniella inopinata TaxID=1696036 RepID=A0A4Q7DIK3_9PROT|nr:aspartate kinase [Candidatus Finniella inopinata]RZI46039.1 aspartate kinase [Candidatus Finniella inopinata]